MSELVNRADYIEEGLDAQRKSVVLLSNKDNTLPLPKDISNFVDGE